MAHTTEVVGSEWSVAAPSGQGTLRHAPRRLNHLRALESESIHMGAGMIQESPADQQTQEEREIAFPKIARNAVSAEERYRRHGHRPAIFLLENRSAVAFQLERALFEKGFEVLLIGGSAESPDSILEAIRTTQRIGAVAIYFGDALDAETKERLAMEANPRLYEISRKSESAGDEQLFLRGLALANSLWLVKPQANQEEAN